MRVSFNTSFNFNHNCFEDWQTQKGSKPVWVWIWILLCGRTNKWQSSTSPGAMKFDLLDTTAENLTLGFAAQVLLTLGMFAWVYLCGMGLGEAFSIVWVWFAALHKVCSTDYKARSNWPHVCSLLSQFYSVVLHLSRVDFNLITGVWFHVSPLKYGGDL